MSVVYEKDNIVIGLDGIEEVERILGNFKAKTPAVAKVAVNSTARYARKEMIQRAKARYAVNAAGERQLNDLKKTKSATNRDVSATLHIRSMRNDLGYFTTDPTRPFMGTAVFHGPDVFTAKVLKTSGMKPLTGTAGLSKGFLLKFSSGHVGMAQRVLGSATRNTVTRAGYPRWKNKEGKVEKLRTMGAPSATAMHRTIWPEVEQQVEDYLMDALIKRAYRVLEIQKAKRK